MKKFFYVIWMILPLYGYADTTSIDAENNMSIIQDSIKINEQEFNNVAEQIAKRYPNFDWVTFDNLDLDARRIVLKNYLARIAFDEVKENYLKDIRARAKDGVITKTDDDETYYFNKSDAKYRTNYIADQTIQEKAKKHHILHPACDDCSLGYVKQKDVKILDEILKQEIANAPVDMYCEKYCYVYNQAQAEIYKQKLAKIKDYMQSYQKIQKQYLSEMRKNGAPRKEIREERKKIANEIRELEESYTNWEKIAKANRTWDIGPYTESCELVGASCWNVEKIPQNQERFDLRMIDHTNTTGIYSIDYDYDDTANNTHTQATAWRDCTCSQDINDVPTYVNCYCNISFFDEIQDFTAVRNWQNQERIDIKNGKLQDRDENGVYRHKWAEIPGGVVHGRILDISGLLNKSETK
ncbi:MAG: hypothetical protein ACLRFM_03150 [Alphaproteobacteria bacterium]